MPRDLRAFFSGEASASAPAPRFAGVIALATVLARKGGKLAVNDGKKLDLGMMVALETERISLWKVFIQSP